MFRFLIRRSLVSIFASVVMLALVPLPAAAQLEIKNEDVTIKFGVQAQFWADWLQDATAPGEA